MTPKKTSPGWSHVKAKLADFDRAGLVGLLQDLYAVDKDNQAFLHARFALAVCRTFHASRIQGRLAHDPEGLNDGSICPSRPGYPVSPTPIRG